MVRHSWSSFSQCRLCNRTAVARRIRHALPRRDADVIVRAQPVLGCDSAGPSPTEPHHPDLFWYGIHGVEILFTIMGPGCRSVTRIYTPGADVVVGRWADGRIGTFRGIREGKAEYRATVYGRAGIRTSDPVVGAPYKSLLQEIVKFFQTGVPPVAAPETLEIHAFMQAAELSKARNGQEVSLSELSW